MEFFYEADEKVNSMMQKSITLFIFLFLFAIEFVNGQDSTATKKERSIAAIPMINYNRTQGIVVGAMVSSFYKINKKDTISPSSNTGLFGM